MRVCPTAAVRIRAGHAVKLEDRCIDCGECVRVCPAVAIVPLTDRVADLSRFDYKIAIPSPALYAQFDAEIFPGVIVAALKRCGFDDVEPLSPACGTITAATDIFLGEYHGQYPLISSFCPTVVRLVQVNYPELIDQLLPILAPREISAGNAKRRKAEELGIPADRIGAVYITPCPSKIVAIQEHPGMKESNLDAAISISDLFPTLASAVAKVDEGEANIGGGESAAGIGWAFLGGSPRSLPAENTLIVAGLPNLIRILDDIEKGKLRRYSYIECHACPEGCVGGCLTVENPYVARANAIRLQQNLPAGSDISREEMEANYRRGAYLMDEALAGRPLHPIDDDISRAIVKMKDREVILAGLPKIDCGACGAPSCGAFAEDVVTGAAEPSACVFSWQKDVAAGIEALAGLIRSRQSTHGVRQ